MSKRHKKDTPMGLMIQALSSARFRGHNMGEWEVVSPTSSQTKCVRCGKYARINTNPAPNEVQISGSAVALSCQGD